MFLSESASAGIVSCVPAEKAVLEMSPIVLAKAVKNETEIRGFVDCHVRDGAALCEYLAWLEKEVPGGNVTEISGADKLRTCREQMSHFVSLSFDTISSSGPNAAIIHYHPQEDSNRAITPEELYLVDSGAQYKDGTTDVTRTVSFGTPSDHERECFTRVLKGQIALRKAVFPEKLPGRRLDSFARSALWQIGLDYLHGTSHGVGAHLNVHEGPVGISWRDYPGDPGVLPGMVLSNEPGYYEAGKFGIRIENLVLTVPAETKFNFKEKRYLTFKDLTMVPIQRKMIMAELLSSEEIDYLNEYHMECREKVGEVLRTMGKKEALNWLMRETEPLG